VVRFPAGARNLSPLLCVWGPSCPLIIDFRRLKRSACKTDHLFTTSAEVSMWSYTCTPLYRRLSGKLLLVLASTVIWFRVPRNP
jgi:hypothetical protein